MNSDYFILGNIPGDDEPFIGATPRSENRNFRLNKLPPFGEPLFFENKYRKEFLVEDIKYPMSDVFIESLGFLCIEGVKDYLSNFNIKGFQLYPAVFIDDQSNWHEDYWYAGFYNTLDCWDRKQSSLIEFPDEFDDENDDEDDLPTVEKFVLDENVLNKIPEEERLLFVMGGCFNPMIFVHKRIVRYFQDAQINGFRLYKIDEYEFGNEIMGINAMTV